MKKRCSYDLVRNDSRWPRFHQCRRNAVVERKGKAFCKLHDPVEVKKRDENRQAKWDAKSKAERPKWYAYDMLALLKESQKDISGNWRKRRDKLINKIEE